MKNEHTETFKLLNLLINDDIICKCLRHLGTRIVIGLTVRIFE